MAVAAVAVLALAACGTKVVKPHGAEQAVVRVVDRQTGFRPTDVSCPDGVEAKAGATFDCHFTGPRGQRYTAHVTVQKVHGTRVLFFIQTRPAR